MTVIFESVGGGVVISIFVLVLGVVLAMISLVNTFILSGGVSCSTVKSE